MFGFNEVNLLLLIFLPKTVYGSHIINGEKAPANSMQYMVSVQSAGKHMCGGFLITEDFVVTAAHCSNSNDLRVVSVSIINKEDCNGTWQYGLPPNVICAGGYNTEKGFCQGDSGGPLVCKGIAVGIVSFNYNFNCAYPNKEEAEAVDLETDLPIGQAEVTEILRKLLCGHAPGVDEIRPSMSYWHGQLAWCCLEDPQLEELCVDREVCAALLSGWLAQQLISEDFVVTAAHCGTPEPDVVVLGSHDLKSSNAEKIKIEKQCKHPDYRDVGFGNDIMLLKLSRKASVNNRVKTIRIPMYDIYLDDNQMCSVAGWGKTETNNPSNDLRVVSVSIINKEVCNKEWQYRLPPNVICAGGYNTRKGFCQGDSGGPLVCNGIAVGVVSFNQAFKCDYPDVPNVYTDISKYRDWLKRTVENKMCS
ncbi:PREDICTED: granzyme A-like [Cyprinodon variegatus]|uniref:granzyme A-like n=1 Tax=Cyprinodon variegatus TaxID=28743 RepID=UPI00074255D3|nr:PREDICTED: granzyme A-like [Cyprinodon variegatus]